MTVRSQAFACNCGDRPFSRRDFLTGAAAAMLVLRAHGADAAKSGSGARHAAGDLPAIDIHAHSMHRDRRDEDFIVHQRNTGIRTTILLPGDAFAHRMWGVAGNDHVRDLARRYPDHFLRYAVEDVSLSGASQVIERELKAGAIGIGELKNKVACDSIEMQRIAGVARDYDVPMLIHFQDGAYNDGFARFDRMLEKFPTVKFIAHAQSFWAHIDGKYQASNGPYPKGSVAAGGLADRWLADYPNFYGDLSAGSGNQALMRDPGFTPGFLTRHQDKLLYGSDCYCPTGVGPQCLAATKLRLLREFARNESILTKILFGNARKLYRIPKAHLAGFAEDSSREFDRATRRIRL